MSLSQKKREIEFSVQDTGIGISEDQKKRIFMKFFRGANAVRMETRGTGLGLFITKNIVEAHGGKIWFESEEGKGTIFYFTLPLGKGRSRELVTGF
jgi:signal transduction histidine kinase